MCILTFWSGFTPTFWCLKELVSEELKERIASDLETILADSGFELVEVKLARFGRNSRLQLFVDSEKGVTLDNCVTISRLLSPVIEQNDYFESEYTLEVSSPGVDRPLKTERDFKRKLGRLVRIEFLDATKSTLQGTLSSVENGVARFEIDGSETIVQLKDIKLAKEEL
ncbi:MAG: ribosome maturation factor RimP [candidate division Zixibacteria bacterium]|nr:ribosome maturation factor RimP [candidate division Zixibacteria bacterium]